MSDAANLLIRKLQTIGHLTDNDKKLLLDLPCRIVSAGRGTTLAADGDVTTRTCLAIRGFLHREKTTPSGARQILSFHPPGDIPDIQSFHLSKMDHSLVATTDATIGFIEHGNLDAVLQQSASLTALMWRESLIDSARFRVWMLMLGQADAEARMAHLFCELFVRMREMGLTREGTFDFPVTQIDMADALGISPVHANRTLQDLRFRSLVSVQRSEVTILDWRGLQQVAEFDPAYLHYADESIGA